LEAVRTLYAYWFRYGSPVTMGVFRALMSGLIFVNGVMVGLFRSDWVSENGYIPAWVASKYLDNRVYLGGDGFSLPRISLLNGVTNPTLLFCFYWLVVLASLLSMLGLWTRVSTAVMAIGVVSLQLRTGPFLHGGDSVMRVCALYIAIAPSGLAFSLDRYIGLRRGTVPLELPLVSLWPQRLVQFNCAIIYFTTTWAKWFGVLWKSGAATWYPARLHEFDRFPVPAFLNDFPMVKVTTWGTLAVEFAMATLVWFAPLRKYVLLAGIGLHLYIEYSMNIPLFAFLMISMYVTYYEGEEVSTWWVQMKSRFGRKAHTATLSSTESVER